MIISKPAIFIFAGNSFHASVKFLPLLILSTYLFGIYKFFQINLLFSEKTKILSLQKFFGAILTVISLFLFLVMLNIGIMGVVYTMVFVSSILLFLGYYHSQKYNCIKYEIKKIAIICLLFTFTWITISALNFNYNLPFEILLKLLIIILELFICAKLIGLNPTAFYRSSLLEDKDND